MTDIASYLNLLYATIGQPHCPRTREPTPSRSSSQILEAILSLPRGSEIELRAPVFKVYGEDLDFVLDRTAEEGLPPVDRGWQARRHLFDEIELDEIGSGTWTRSWTGSWLTGNTRKPSRLASPARCLSATDYFRSRSSKEQARGKSTRFYAGLCSPTHHFVYGDIAPRVFFMFNNPESACRTCGGLGVDKLTHPELLVPDPTRSILGGCFVREAFKYNPDTWDGRMMFSLASALDFLARHAMESAAGAGAARDPLWNRLDRRSG